MAKISALGHVGVSLESTFGTAVVPTLYIPYNTIKVEDDIKKVVDDGRGRISRKTSLHTIQPCLVKLISTHWPIPIS